MASKKSVTIELDLQDRDAKKKLQGLAKETGKTEDAFEDAESAGKAMARAIQQSADDMIDEIDATRRAVDALERNLGDLDADPREVVADLKRVGLTAQDIENDAEQLGAALQRAGDVKIHATKQGFDDLGQAVGSVRDETGRARDTMSGFIGGTVGELPGISEAMGPVGEGLGQLAEGALSGEINFKQLALAGGAMAGVAFVLGKVQGRMQRIAENKAWKSEQVESYTDALEDTDSVLEAVANKIEEAGELTLSLMDGLIEIDTIPLLNQAGLDVDAFAELVAGGQDKIDAYAQAMDDAGVPIDHYRWVVAAAEQEVEFLADAQEAAAVAAEFFGDANDDAAAATEAATDAVEEHADALRDNVSALEEQIDAQRASVDAAYAVVKAEYAMTDAVFATHEILNTAEEGSREYTEAAIELAESAQAVADAKVREAEETAEANGATISATQAVDIQNQSLLEQAANLNGPQRAALIGHIARLNNIPTEVESEIQAAINRGDLATAERLLNNASRSRGAAVRVDVNYASLNYAERQLAYLARPRSSALAVASAMRFRQEARGTPYSPGGTTLVGEEGPEIVEMPMGASVTDAQASKGRMNRLGSPGPAGGRVVNNYITQNFPAGIRSTDVMVAQRRYSRIQGPL